MYCNVSAFEVSKILTSVSGARRIAAATWADLQREVEAATGPIYVTLSGSLTADTPLVVSSKPSLVVVAGPADITCSDTSGSSAFVIQRSTAVMLQDLTISGCSGTAISVNGTAGATAPAPITTAAGGGRAMPAPNVVLKNVAVSSCSGGRGAAIAASNSRLVLDGCSFTNNTAQGCGAGLFADRAAVLVLNSEFMNNQGSSAGGFGDSCRGGAIHAQRSWLGAARSSFAGNRAANGSAVLLLQPVGMSQLQDCSFESNQPRPGTSADFVSSSGAVGLVGAGVTHVLQRGVSDCEPVKDGLTVARCTFSNNTAEINGGRGGSIAAYDTYLGVINTTFVGSTASSHAASASSVAGHTARERKTAINGGCMALESATLLISGSSFSRCNAQSNGGAISMRAVTSVIRDSAFASSSADSGGAIRATSGYHLLSNVSITNCQALNAAAGLWLTARSALDVHMQGCTLEGNSLTGKGGALQAESEGDVFTLSIHDSRFTRNTASFGAGLSVLAKDLAAADIRNNVFAHNTALQAGGGLWCSNKAVDTEGTAFRLTNNTWLNNTALIRGGGVITNPCNVTLHGDRFLGNSAAQEGGGLMVYGGQGVVLHNTQVSCNSAQQGAGVAVKLADEGVDSGVTIKCSSITANGVASDAAARQACMKGVLAAAALAKPASGVFLAAAATAASSPAEKGQAASTDAGGGLWVAAGQQAVLISSIVGGNRAVKSGAGVQLDKGASLEIRSSAAGTTAVSHNNCTAGSGGALFMANSASLLAVEAKLNNNRATFGGALFALGGATHLQLKAVTMNNNTATVGGAVATLGGSTINCTAGCTFNFNQAKVGGALMLHRGSSILASATLQGNIAAAATGAAAATAAATIYYKLGEVPTSAGGAVYAWMGALQLTRCTVSSNVAWGANGRGGGVFVHGASLQVKDTVFADNYASSAGGAVLLGPLGAHSLKVTRSNFTGNAARQYGGALAAGLLLPGDAAAANAQAVQREPDSSWRLQLSGTHFASNTAGKQGGALACSLCDSVAITYSSFTSNAAVQTGGGISCVSCQAYFTDGCSFLSNLAASGAGACILAAGDGSTTSNNVFARNVAGQAAAADASARLNAAAAAAGNVAASHHSVSAIGDAASAAATAIPMLSSRDTLPACGVVGTGGGMCLGLWDAGFSLLGRNSFSNNSAVYGAGLFIEACPEGAEQCPLLVDVGKLVFKGNALAAGGAAAAAGVHQRRLLQAQGSGVSTAVVLLDAGASLGSGADVYATNATVLVKDNGAPPAAAKQPASAAAKPALEGRHLLQTSNATATAKQPPSKSKASEGKALAVAQQLATAVTTPVRSGNGSSSTQSQASRFATGPSQLGPVQLATGRHSSSQQQQQQQLGQEQGGLVSTDGRMVPVVLAVLDQLASQVSASVAEQLSVVAELANCSTCMVGGISKVQPSSGAAVFDSIQLLAPPGTNQSVTYTLLNATGARLGAVQSVAVRLPSCSWGQARKIDGCSNCSYPMFTFSNPQRSNCSICPANSRNCSGTTLLPDTGYWQSGPLSAHMIKCPRKAACRRDATAEKRLACLQQQQLMLNNQGYSDDIGAAIKGRRSSRTLTPWDALREECRLILQQLAAGSTQPGSGPGYALPALIDKVLLGSNRHLLQGTAPLMEYPALNSSEAIADAYAAIMCAEGYQGRLCAHCLFPGSQQSGAWGSTFSGSCGRCPSRSVAASAYALSRLFDFAMVGLLIITTLVEMKKRRADVVKARQAMLAKLAGKGGKGGAGGSASSGAAGTTPAAAGSGGAGAGATISGGQLSTKHNPGSAATSNAAGCSGAAATPPPACTAAPVQAVVDPFAPRLQYKKPLQRVPLFVREVLGSSQGRKRAVASYTPADLQLGKLFEVLKDFLQVLGILQTLLLSFQTAAATATAANSAASAINVTPMSTEAWISLDCLLPRTLDAARQRQMYHIAAQLLLPVCYALIVLAIFLAYAGYVSLRTRQPLWRGVLGVRLQAPIISSCLVVLSYFYPSVAYTVLGVFSCRYLDPSSGSSSSVEGEVLRAPGWYWALDLERQCFVDGEHRALALGLGIPGALLLLAYPLAQALVLARRVAAGQVTGTSEFFARYGHLVEDFRPRLFFWASVVELRKLLLVAVVLGFESTGVLSQLMACGALLLGYCAALMGLLPYPYRLLNRLHLAAGGVLLAVVWINLYIATDGDAGDALSTAALGRRSLGLQLLSVVLVLTMVALLLLMFAVRVARQVKAVLDVDGDGRVSRADIDALLARLQREGGMAAKLLSCLGPRRRRGAAAAATAGRRGAAASP
ncbi:hypothetical protein OEZ85_008667 [Tetradesmus obliquus]|uniref:Probable pectate lyase C n=1 Tax=Tetradesmus obliquus TaxID=3088 RepID=A0ABY8TK11_TETOB|nr:hypothetical protein OEZ85_008667 [Tetradesmus obliquus]